MFNSIRWSMQLWHAGLLALVLVGFGSASYYGISRARYQKVDAELEREVQLLAAGLRYPPRPPRGLQGGPDGPGGPGGRFGGAGIGGGPGGGPNGPPPWEFQQNEGGPRRGGGRGGGPRGVDPFLTEIEVPPIIAQRFGDGENGTNYYFIWDYDREAIKTSRPAKDIPDTGPPRPFPPGPGFGGGPPTPEPPTIRQRGEFREAYMNGPANTRMLVGRSMQVERAELRRTAWLLVAAGASVLVIGLVGGWVISLGVVRPIRHITHAAQDISATNLSRRIDVTETQSELGTLATVMNDMFSRLESSFQQQVRFTADASHELRTPLSVIHTHAQLALSRDRSADEYKRTIATMLRASTRMKGLVDSLLLLAGADAGRMSIDRQPFDLQDVIDECIMMVTPLANEKGITLEADLKSAEVFADPAKISQVAINLMSNAIRYNCEKGSVSVKIRNDGTDTLLIIADTGVGIPQEHLPHLFERFYRADVARRRDVGGSGLGLAICKSIIDAHGGRIDVESTPEKGSTFTVRIPGPPKTRGT